MNRRSSLLYNLFFTAVLTGALPASAQSLWKPNSARSMLADRRAHGVGDIVTILVQESNSAQKANSTSTAKKSGINDSISTLIYPPSVSGALTKGGNLPALNVSANDTFDGSGKVNNSEALNGSIAVRVIDVLPNGNLVLEGSRKTTFSGETTEAILHGVVRSDDVSAANTVLSYNIADATVRYVSSGTATEAQKKGWFSKTWDKVSPF